MNERSIVLRRVGLALRYLLACATLVLAAFVLASPAARGVPHVHGVLVLLMIALSLVFWMRARRMRGWSVFQRPSEMVAHGRMLEQQSRTLEPLFTPLEYVAWVLGFVADVFLSFV